MVIKRLRPDARVIGTDVNSKALRYAAANAHVAGLEIELVASDTAETLGFPLDNVEGMTFGPKLPDGRRALLLVSDNNFSAAGFTQFLLFAVSTN